jgi:hypothetical protein
MQRFRYVDILLLAVGAAVVLPLGAPVLGYAIGAGTWLLQRIVQAADKRWIAKVDKPVKRAGYTLFEAFGRIWLLAGGLIVAIVIGSRADALTAGLVIVCAYTIEFVVRLTSGPPSGQPAR